MTAPSDVSAAARLLPSLCFYPRFLWTLFKSSRLARAGTYDYEAWWASSIEVLRHLEAVGVQVEADGLDNIRQTSEPIVFVGNHLSVLETVVLPALIVPHHPVTYVIKESLLEVPLFKHVMRSRNPIAVTRTNPRQDLKTVLEQGVERLGRGISVIIFPQTTRAPFNPEQFSTIAVKLAARAGAPLVPLALLTDAWANGKLIKDFGFIDPGKKVYFRFGEPLRVEGKGSAQHQEVLDFIQRNLEHWLGDRENSTGRG